MNKDQFLKYLEHPELLDETSLPEISALVKEYPYFQAAQMLYTKNLHSTENIKYHDQLKLTSAYINNRKKLYYLIKLKPVTQRKPHPEPIIETIRENIQPEKTTVVEPNTSQPVHEIIEEQKANTFIPYTEIIKTESPAFVEEKTDVPAINETSLFSEQTPVEKTEYITEPEITDVTDTKSEFIELQETATSENLISETEKPQEQHTIENALTEPELLNSNLELAIELNKEQENTVPALEIPETEPEIVAETNETTGSQEEKKKEEIIQEKPLSIADEILSRAARIRAQLESTETPPVELEKNIEPEKTDETVSGELEPNTDIIENIEPEVALVEESNIEEKTDPEKFTEQIPVEENIETVQEEQINISAVTNTITEEQPVLQTELSTEKIHSIELEQPPREQTNLSIADEILQRAARIREKMEDGTDRKESIADIILAQKEARKREEQEEKRLDEKITIIEKTEKINIQPIEPIIQEQEQLSKETIIVDEPEIELAEKTEFVTEEQIVSETEPIIIEPVSEPITEIISEKNPQIQEEQPVPVYEEKAETSEPVETEQPVLFEENIPEIPAITPVEKYIPYEPAFDYSTLVKTETKEPETSIVAEEVKEQSFSFSDWLNKVNKNKPKEKPIAEKPKETKINYDLIDKFIREEPRIIPTQNATSKPIEDVSKKSLEDSDTFFTETLAKIYIKQSCYSKALSIYEKLSLKFPEKTTYFAEKIIEIKRLINKE